MVYSSLFGNKNAYFGNIPYGVHEEDSGTPTGSCTLFIEGFAQASGNTTLYTEGFDTETSNCTLYIDGEQVASSGMSLFIEGLATTPSGTMNLFVGATYEGSASGVVDLSIKGTDTGSESITGTTTLFTKGFTLQESGSLNLFIQGVGDTSSNLNLSLWNETPSINGGVTLMVNNNWVDAGLNLHTIAGGFINPTANIDPLVQGSVNGGMNLYIGRNDSNEVLTLFLKATEASTQEDLPLFMQGSVPISSGVDMYVKGFITPSGMLPVYIKGY